VRAGAVSRENGYKWAEEAVKEQEKEPSEEQLLIKAIKTFTKEKKANHALGYDSDDEFFKDGNEMMNRTSTSKFRETMSSFKKKKPPIPPSPGDAN
jgi:hypothetical protein